MEVRHYAHILWRRLWVIVLVFGIVLLYVGYQVYKLDKTPGALKAYQSVITLQIGLQASANGPAHSYSDYQSTSEALADELVTGPVLTSHEFAAQVTQQIQADTDQITQRFGAGADLGNLQDLTAIGSSITTTRTHTLVTISVNWSTPAGAWAIAHAIGEVSANQLGTFLDYEVRATPASTQATVTARVISSASTPVAASGTQSHKLTLLLLLLLVALVIGIALAFLIEYLDDRLYSAEAAARLTGLPIVGEVPNRKPGL